MTRRAQIGRWNAGELGWRRFFGTGRPGHTRRTSRTSRAQSGWPSCGSSCSTASPGPDSVKTNPDFRDLLAELNAAGAEYLVVGAHALAVHGHPRASKDLDLWIRATPENAERVYRALGNFGAPLRDLNVEDLATPGTIFQIGVDPVRIDIITTIDGVEFENAWPERVGSTYADQPVSVISREHFIQNKKAAGRLQDLADVDALERHDRKAKGRG